MNITGAKALEDQEPKSKQEIEEALIKKEEDKNKPEEKTEDKTEEKPEEKDKVVSEFTDNDVLTHLKNKYGKDVKSVDELLATKDTASDLSDDIKTFQEYQKETGRGMEDFVKLNRDYSEIPGQKLLENYYKQTEEGLDDDDIADLVNDNFGYDEDLDDESDIKAKKRAKKQEITKAKKFFEEQKEKYKAPLESKGVDSESAEEIKLYKSQLKEAEDTKAENKKKSEWFTKKSDELFSNEFKGFEFNIGDEKVTFKPAEADALKVSNDSPFNFISKHLGEDGMLKDAEGYHKALSIAMDPDKFANYFYEQGQAAAVDNFSKKSKNINTDSRNAPDVRSKGGMTVTAVNPSNRRGDGLVIKSKR